MSLLNEFRSDLPVRVSTGNPASAWCCKSEEIAGCVSDVVDRISRPERINAGDLLKQARRRLIFKHQIENMELVVKAFPLDSIGKQLQHKKYAYTEVGNILHGQGLNIPSPQIFGFGYRKSYALTRWSALIMECVPYPSMEQLLVGSRDMQLRYRLLERVYPMFELMYRTGCNHIDFKPGSVHMDEMELRIVDFQYVSYMEKSQPLIMASQAGHFAWDVSVKNNWATVEHMQDWFSGLMDYLGVIGDDKVWAVFHRTHARRYPIADRMNGIAGQS